MPADLEALHNIVAKTPGARVFQPGDRMPEEEECEEEDQRWARGEFDALDDSVVTGLRLRRGEGRGPGDPAPHPDELDDVTVTLRGSPATGLFFADGGQPEVLTARPETRWRVALSDPRLSPHWVASLRAMARGDICRFTCAAKRSQAWLQSFADCCASTEPGNAPPAEDRMVVPTCTKSTVVQLRLDEWRHVTDVSSAKDRSLLKRVIAPAPPPDESLAERLRHVGGAPGEARAPRPSDRVVLAYRVFVCRAGGGGAWQLVHDAGIGAGSRAACVSIGGDGGGGGAPRVLELAAMQLLEGEHASFSFGASAEMLGDDGSPPPEAWWAQLPADGAAVQLEARLCRVLRRVDVSDTRDGSAFKRVLVTPSGFWRPRDAYVVELLCAPLPRDDAAAAAGEWDEAEAATAAVAGEAVVAPHGARRVRFAVGGGDGGGEGGGEGVSVALQACVRTMACGEVSLLEASRAALAPWPAALAPLPAAAAGASGTQQEEEEEATMCGVWVQLVGMRRVEVLAPGVAREALDDDDVGWLERAFVEGKGELPVLADEATLTLRLSLSDAEGAPLAPLAPPRRCTLRCGALPFAEDWMLELVHTLRPGEKLAVRCSGGGGGGEAAAMVRAACELANAQRATTVQEPNSLGELEARGGDIEELRALLARGDRAALTERLKALGYAKMGHRVQMEKAMLAPSSPSSDGEGARRSAPLDAAAVQAAAAAGGGGEVLVGIEVLGVAPPPRRRGVDTAALLAEADATKARANALYGAGHVAGAMRKWLRANWYLRDDDDDDDDDDGVLDGPMVAAVGTGGGGGGGAGRFGAAHAEEVLALRVSLHLNMAAAALKLGELDGARAAAEVAVALQPGAAKPLYRLAQAQLAQHEHAQVAATLETLLRHEPGHAEAAALLRRARQQREAAARRDQASFGGMFARAQGQREGALFGDAEVAAQGVAERARSRNARDREEEVRRGVEVYDTKALARLPAEHRQRYLDGLNDAIEHEERQDCPAPDAMPPGMSEAMWKQAVTLRTDGVAEEEVQAALRETRRKEVAEVRIGMSAAELQRMAERHDACERDRYKPDEVVQQREDEMWTEFDAVKRRVALRLPLMRAHAARQAELAREAQATLDDADADDDARARAMRKMLHDRCVDLDDHLSADERDEMQQLQARARAPGGERPLDEEDMRRLELLIHGATVRRIEQAVDEQLRKQQEAGVVI